MSSTDDHERYLSKNKSLAAANEMEKRDRSMESKGFNQIQRQEEASCFNCKRKGKCVEFRSKRTGSTTGVASYGGHEKIVCARYEPVPAENKGISDRQIKSLLKGAMRGLR